MDLQGNFSTVSTWACCSYTIKNTFFHFLELQEEELTVDSERTGGGQYNGRKQQRSLSAGAMPPRAMKDQARHPPKRDIPAEEQAGSYGCGKDEGHDTEAGSYVSREDTYPGSSGQSSRSQGSEDSQSAQNSQEDVLNGVQSGLTTLMLQNIPTRFTQRSLLRKVNRAGFLRQYDFFYLPLDKRSRANRGFAFVNFLSAGRAKRFVKSFDGRSLEHSGISKVVRVKLAALQGIDMLKQRFRDVPEDGHGPIFLNLPTGRRGTAAGEQEPGETKSGTVCSRCDFRFDAGYQFCPMCGTPVGPLIR